MKRIAVAALVLSAGLTVFAEDLLAQKEPYVSSVERKTSKDKELGENWWEKRHAAILEEIKTHPEYDLVLAGDSITHRWERHGKEAYVAVTNEFKVLNLGFGGDGVKNLLWRLRSGELDGYRAKAVQVMIGTNNSSKPEETAAQIRACLREIRKRQPQAKIILCAILPRGKPEDPRRARNAAVNALLQPLADGKTIIWKDWSSDFLKKNGQLYFKYCGDGVHPNAAGYAMWRDASLPFWREVLGRPQGN